MSGFLCLPSVCRTQSTKLYSTRSTNMAAYSFIVSGTAVWLHFGGSFIPAGRSVLRTSRLTFTVLKENSNICHGVITTQTSEEFRNTHTQVYACFAFLYNLFTCILNIFTILFEAGLALTVGLDRWARNRSLPAFFNTARSQVFRQWDKQKGSPLNLSHGNLATLVSRPLFDTGLLHREEVELQNSRRQTWTLGQYEELNHTTRASAIWCQLEDFFSLK